MTYWRLYYHLVWSTRDRMPLIDQGRANTIQDTVVTVCREEGCLPHAIGIVADHVHIAVSIPPRLAVADLVRRLKSATSRVINQGVNAGPSDQFAWQGEYGVLSFGERSLPDIVSYVENQETRHAANELLPNYELTDNPTAPPRLT